VSYSSDFLQFVIGGTITSAGSVEEWQVGMKVPVGPGLNISDNDSTLFLSDAQADATTWWNALRAYYHSTTALSFVRVNHIGTDGLYRNKAKSYRQDFFPLGGTAGGTPLPSEVAMVATFMTANARGLASKGRIYLPAPSALALGGDGRVGSNFSDPVRTATAQLVSNVGNLPFTDAVVGAGDVSVMSRVGLGAANKVTGIRTDNLWDTQRRRGNRFAGVVSVTTPLP
jgi:hypothetical protein